MNKIETKNKILEIFKYIENGKVIIDNKKFNGHPDLYFFHQKEEFYNELELLLNKEEYDRYDIYYIVQRLIKFLLNKYDSHTRMWFLDKINFPIKFKIENNKVYVINITNDLKNVIGGELIAINDIPINNIITELERIICYSTKGYLDSITCDCLVQINILKSLPGINNNISKINYKVKYNGEEHEIIFDENNSYTSYTNNNKENYSYEVRDNILIINYNSCRDREKMNNLINQLKKEELTDDIKYYIVDIRNNGGGDSSIIEPLIEFLSDKDVVTLVNEKVFSSGEMAMIDLKKIGSYIIGSGIGTSLNYFGETPDKLDLKDMDLSIKRSNRYWFCNDDLSYKSLVKENFEDYFKDKSHLLEPVLFAPDDYIEMTVHDIITNNDIQLKKAIEYIKYQLNNKHIQ